MSNKKRGWEFPKEAELTEQVSIFLGEKYVSFQPDTKRSYARLRKDSLRKSGEIRHALFCCTFKVMTKQVLRDSTLFDKRGHFADFFEKKKGLTAHGQLQHKLYSW